MFAASKFGRHLPAIQLRQQDSELLAQINVELRQYIDNMDHVKCVALISPYIFSAVCHCACSTSASSTSACVLH